MEQQGPGAGATARAVVARAFVIQNVTIGASFGMFSVTVLPLQQHFEASLASVTFGLAFVSLAMGLLAPPVAKLLQRFGFRQVMYLGALLSTAGYLLLAFAPGIGVVLAAYALLVGPGAALAGSLSTSTLTSLWVKEKPGRALGFVNAPVLVALAPLIGYAVLAQGSLQLLYLLLAAANLLLFPIIAGVVEPPFKATGATGLATPTTGARQILARPFFWLIVLVSGILAAISIIAISHVIVIGVEKGLTSSLATLLASILGGAAILGALLVGFIADRLGGARTLALEALLYALCWGLLFLVHGFLPILPLILLIGACGAAIYPATVVVMSHFLDEKALATGLGLNMMLCLPFTFLVPPLAGALRDHTGHYAPVMALVVAASVVVVFLALLLARHERDHTAFVKSLPEL